MPEQIQAAALDQVRTGKPHDLAHPLTVSGTVAMNLAMFTGRLRVKRTADPSLDGILKKFMTVVADPNSFKAQPGQAPSFVERAFLASVVTVAENAGKSDQHLEVLQFFSFERWIVHAPRLTNLRISCHDLGQVESLHFFYTDFANWGIG